MENKVSIIKKIKDVYEASKSKILVAISFFSFVSPSMQKDSFQEPVSENKIDVVTDKPTFNTNNDDLLFEDYNKFTFFEKDNSDTLPSIKNSIKKFKIEERKKSFIEIQTKQDTLKMVADILIENNLNTLGNLSVDGRYFSKEELKEINACQTAQDVTKVALKNAKRTKREKGVKTFCLTTGRGNFASVGISINAYGQAYKAIKALDESNDFIRVRCDNFRYLTDGSPVVYGSGPEAPFGHFGTKVSFNGNPKLASTHLDNAVNTSSYGSINYFMLSENTVNESLLITLLSEKKEDEIVKLLNMASQASAQSDSLSVPPYMITGIDKEDAQKYNNLHFVRPQRDRT